MQGSATVQDGQATGELVGDSTSSLLLAHDCKDGRTRNQERMVSPVLSKECSLISAQSPSFKMKEKTARESHRHLAFGTSGIFWINKE